MLGVNVSSKSIQIDDKQTEEELIAEMDGDFQTTPSLSLRSEQNYFGNSDFGYFYQLDGSLFDISEQNIDGTNSDVATSIEGYSLFAVPTLYYHFNADSDNWSQKIGIGFGVGYVNMSGTFKITKSSHPNYNQIKTVDVDAVDMAVGIFIEISNDDHSFVLQNFSPSVSDDNFEYMQHNVEMIYRYKFSLD